MKNKKSIIVVLILCCLLVGFVVSTQGVESVRVSCYVGDPSDNKHPGSLETLDVSNAANLCNNMFIDCNGECTACYEKDGGATLCVDSAGTQYTGEIERRIVPHKRRSVR